MSFIQDLFTEVYRPKTIDDIVLLDRVKRVFKDAKAHQNYIFYGTSGLGKTSLAKILTSGLPTLYINVSSETGIDTIREKITDWCNSASFIDDSLSVKYIILDELDGASDSFFNAFRATIEKYAKSIRFIATCNYINKIPTPIQSRFECVNFNPLDSDEDKELFIKEAKLVKSLLEKVGIKHTKESVVTFVKSNYPDLRVMINKIQSWVISGINEINNETVKDINYTFSDVFNLILDNTDPIENYKLIVREYSSKTDDVLKSLSSDFIKFLNDKRPDLKNKVPYIIVEIANYQYQRNFVIDKVVSLLACIYKLQNIIHSK